MAQNKYLTSRQLTVLSLQNAWEASMEDYRRSLTHAGVPHWDMVLLTASDEAQAKGYEQQLAFRRRLGMLPKQTEFSVMPDRDGKRIGSGGAALSVIRYLKNRFGSLKGKRILTVQAGGFSQRCPQYSVLGKLFSPVPAMLGDHPGALFDMLMVSMATMPSRMSEGMLLLSGDVFTLFDPLQCNFFHADAAVLTVKESAEIASKHGVCLPDERTGRVKVFLHKQPVPALIRNGAVDSNGCCALDTGTVYLGISMLDRLCSLVERQEDYDAMVNDTVRLSLYGDISFALSQQATSEQLQKQTPEGRFCRELTAARHRLWQAIGSCTVQCIVLNPGRFAHFGTIPDIMRQIGDSASVFHATGWKNHINSAVWDERVFAYQSVLCPGAKADDGVYLEESYVHPGAKIGRGAYLSFADIPSDLSVPPHVLLHGLRQRDGGYVCRIMGTCDNPKEDRLFGVALSQISALLDAPMGNTLWDSDLYPVCDSLTEAAAAAVNLYRLIKDGAGELRRWQQAPKASLSRAFENGDTADTIERHIYMGRLITMERIGYCARHALPCAADGQQLLPLTEEQNRWLREQISRLDLSRPKDCMVALRLYNYIGTAAKSEYHIRQCFHLLSRLVLKHTPGLPPRDRRSRVCLPEAEVQLPLRVNWGGGWTDTFPTCMELGGAVINAAITLNGKLPVKAWIRRTGAPNIVLSVDDTGERQVFTSAQELQACGDPLDPFCLHKACFSVCGVLAQQSDFDETVNAPGGGFELHTQVDGVPKGSGLGTSSILAGAVIQVILTFFGVPFNTDTLYSGVLAAEQLMTTGGGWQDQVGGLTPGVKFITSCPGLAQGLTVKTLSLSEKTKAELDRRYAIVYTGQRRLAKNLLVDVVGRYLRCEEESVQAHREIKVVAAQMSSALEAGEVDAFADLLERHWALSKQIDSGCTNLLMERIFDSVDDLIDGRMVCGAGNGGFLQVVLKKNVSKAQLRHRLHQVFPDSEIDVWDSKILFA